MTTDFVCPRMDCGHEWSMEADAGDLFDGYGNPPCPKCGTNAAEASDFADWQCPQGHSWRTYGNGGLLLGMVPRCVECNALPVDA
jgi:hypothetical protein